MKLKEAFKIRDENRDKLINTLFAKSRSGWTIRDVIVSDSADVGKLYTRMWDNDLSNEAALNLFQVKEDDFGVFVISHQWSWVSGDPLFQEISAYLKEQD